MTKNTIITIITHNNPNNISTLNYLLDVHCDYPIYLIIDNKDKCKDDYYRLYNNVQEFDLDDYRENIDYFIADKNIGAATPARNASLDLGRKLGAKYVVLLDDDLNGFSYVYNYDNHIKRKPVKEFSKLLDNIIEFMYNGNISATSFSYRASYFGGLCGQNMTNKLLRNELAQALVIDVSKDLHFSGVLLEDMNFWINYGNLGHTMLRFGELQLNSELMNNRTDDVGLNKTYATYRYIAPQFAVMTNPGSVVLKYREDRTTSVHGAFKTFIKLNNTLPKIISSDYKKE